MALEAKNYGLLHHRGSSGRAHHGRLRTQAVRVTAKLGIPDRLRDGPKTSRRCRSDRTHEPSLRRLLRTLYFHWHPHRGQLWSLCRDPDGRAATRRSPTVRPGLRNLDGGANNLAGVGRVDEVILTGEPALSASRRTVLRLL